MLCDITRRCHRQTQLSCLYRVDRQANKRGISEINKALARTHARMQGLIPMLHMSKQTKLLFAETKNAALKNESMHSAVAAASN